MTNVIIYSDYDGTLTQRSGNNTVFTPFYQSLLQGYKTGVTQDSYKTPLLKSETEVQELFAAKFGKYDNHFDHTQVDADMLISADAVTFLHEILKNEQIKLRIITKNRKDYIQAMLQYQGFTPEEINKMIIFDSGLKMQSVLTDLQPHLHKEVSKIYILDDSKPDFGQMLRAVSIRGFKDEQIQPYNLMPGQFEWSSYQRDIQQLFSISTELSDEVVHQTTITTIQPSEESKPVITEEHAQLSETHFNATEAESETLLPETTSTSNRTPKMVGYSSFIGFCLGFILGTTLVGTGVFTGAGLISAMAVGLITAATAAVLSGTIGYVITKMTVPLSLEQQDDTLNSSNSTQALQRLGGTTKQPDISSPIEHFSKPLSPPPKTTVVEESPPAEFNTLKNS